MTATDVTGFDAIFSTGFFATFSPDFRGLVLLNCTYKYWRKKQKIQWRASSGDGAPKLQISVPCRGRTCPEFSKWADPGVLWKKAPRAIRAMRGKTLQTVPFKGISTILWVHQKLPQSTVSQAFPSNKSYESKAVCNRTPATVLWVPLSKPIFGHSAVSPTLWHEIITKIIPWELFFVIFEGFYALEISRKERHFQGITYEIRNFPKIIISE